MCLGMSQRLPISDYAYDIYIYSLSYIEIKCPWCLSSRSFVILTKANLHQKVFSYEKKQTHTQRHSYHICSKFWSVLYIHFLESIHIRYFTIIEWEVWIKRTQKECLLLMQEIYIIFHVGGDITYNIIKWIDI